MQNVVHPEIVEAGGRRQTDAAVQKLRQGLSTDDCFYRVLRCHIHISSTPETRKTVTMDTEGTINLVRECYFVRCFDSMM
jgi:hypothetical protein